MNFIPDQNLDQCHVALEELMKDAKEVSQLMAVEGDGDMAEMLTIMFIAGTTQTMMLWHMIKELEKKIDALNSSDLKKKRFDLEN